MLNREIDNMGESGVNRINTEHHSVAYNCNLKFMLIAQMLKKSKHRPTSAFSRPLRSLRGG
jgi:hypothetical protein